jgi:hypothetical protein
MTIPSITSITPTIAPTGGGVLVEIFGDGFQLPAAATMAGPATRLAPTVAVRVGGRAASDVRVTAPGRLTCIVPPGDVGPADVVVQNVDVDGVVILGEQAVTLDAITYLRPALTVEADMTRLVRGLIHELKRQVLENVVLTVHTDFDDEAGAEREQQVLDHPMPGLGQHAARRGDQRRKIIAIEAQPTDGRRYSTRTDQVSISSTEDVAMRCSTPAFTAPP